MQSHLQAVCNRVLLCARRLLNKRKDLRQHLGQNTRQNTIDEAMFKPIQNAGKLGKGLSEESWSCRATLDRGSQPACRRNIAII